MKQAHRIVALNVLKKADWLKSHPSELADSLLNEGRLRYLATDEWAQAEGDDQTGLFIVIDGILHTYYAPRGDKVMMIGFATPGTVLGHTTRYSGGPRLVTAICAEPSILLIISKSALERIAAKTPEIWRAIADLTYNDLQRILGLAAEFISLRPRQRIAARLLSILGTEQGDNPPVIKVSQELLGEMVGATRKTVNIHLASFVTDGLVELGYGRIQICNREGLHAIVEGRNQ